MIRSNTKLARMMAARGLRNKDVHERSGIPDTLVCEQKRKGIKTLRVARRYAAVLKCDPLELID